MYIVVTRTIGGKSDGAITWISFSSKEEFDESHTAKMKDRYRVVEKGISKDRAIELCSTPEANLAIMRNGLREIDEAMSQI